jgi:hypothetical protein
LFISSSGNTGFRCNITLTSFNRKKYYFYSSFNNIRYVHRSRHFDDDLKGKNIDESYHNSLTSINKFEYSTNNYRKPSSISSSSNSSNTIHLRRHSRSIIQKRRVTIILIFCLFVALLLWTPQSLSLTYETLIESFSEMSYQHRIILLIFNNFANLFLCINASIDFILYCFLSEKFARTCKQIFCRQCSNHKIINGQHPRLSIDRTSIVLANPSNNIHQQQLAANTTNKYYIQLYDFYRSSSGYKTNPNKKWKEKFVRSITINTKSDKHIFYQKNLVKNKQIQQSLNIISNPILEYIDENDVNNEINTTVSNETKQSRSGTLTNV